MYSVEQSEQYFFLTESVESLKWQPFSHIFPVVLGCKSKFSQMLKLWTNCLCHELRPTKMLCWTVILFGWLMVITNGQVIHS